MDRLEEHEDYKAQVQPLIEDAERTIRESTALRAAAQNIRAEAKRVRLAFLLKRRTWAQLR